MKKEFVFAAKFDTSDFDRSIEQMQRKLKEVYAPSDTLRMQQQTAQRLQSMGFGGMMSSPTQAAYNQSTNSGRRELERSISEEAKTQEKLGKLIAQRSDTLKKMRDQQKDLIAGSKEELALKEKISRVEENNHRLRENYKQRDAALNQMMDARESMRPQGLERLAQAYQGGGVGGAARAGWRMFGQNPMGYLGAGLSGAGYLLDKGSQIYRDFNAGPVRTEQAMGSAIGSTYGRDVQNIYGRRTAFENMFAPERSRAAQMAIDKSMSDRNADRMSLLGNGAMAVGGGALAMKGGAVGGTFGSAVPILGTGLGAIVGSLPGLIAMGKGLMGMLGDERQRSLLMSPFSSTANRRYESMVSAQLGKDYEATLQAQKDQNPFKTMAVQEYEQNYGRNLQAQRSMGLRNNQFYGDRGFLRQGINGGFTPEMMLEMSQGIMGAGGSTRAATGTSLFGNQLSRGLNMTNAGQVLGSISSGVGSAESTRQATIKILAEGMKLGLDDSNFAEENRRFTAIAADIISKSGARTEGDFQRVAGGFGNFVADNTTLGLGAAQGAYEQYQSISSTTSGPRGVMRAAGFLSNPKLSKLSTIEKQALMQVPEQELNADNPLVQGLAEKYNIPVDQFVESIMNVNQGAVSRFAEHDKIRDRLKSGGVDIGRASTDQDYRSSLTQDQKNDMTALMAYQTTEHGYKGQRQMTAFAQGIVGGRPADTFQNEREGSIEAAIKGDTGRMEDSTVKAMAADSGTVLKNFNGMSTEMKIAAETAAAYTDKIREMNAEMIRLLETARTTGNGDYSAVMKAMQNYRTGNQPQSNKPRQ